MGWEIIICEILIVIRNKFHVRKFDIMDNNDEYFYPILITFVNKIVINGSETCYTFKSIIRHLNRPTYVSVSRYLNSVTDLYKQHINIGILQTVMAG